MALYDSAELLTSIKNRGMIPANAGGWTDAELLKAASEEILTWQLPLLVGARGEYLVKDQFISIGLHAEPAFPASTFDVSYRAAAVRLVKYVPQSTIDIDNFDATNVQESPLDELTPTRQAALSLRRDLRGNPRFYAFREGRIELYPAPNTTGILWVKYHIRPSRLVAVADCRQLTAIGDGVPSTGLVTLTFSVIGTTLAGAIGTKYDVVDYRNPFTIKAFDVPTTTVMTNAVTTTMVISKEALFATDALRGSALTFAVGDWLCPVEKTPVPNVPVELHSAIALRAGAAACAARNPSLQQMLVGEATAKEQALLGGILAPRNKGSVKRLIQRRW